MQPLLRQKNPQIDHKNENVYPLFEHELGSRKLEFKMSGNRNAPFCFSSSFCLFKVHLPHVESRESEVVAEVSLKSEVSLLNSRPRLRLHKATIMVYSLCAIFD